MFFKKGQETTAMPLKELIIVILIVFFVVMLFLILKNLSGILK